MCVESCPRAARQGPGKIPLVSSLHEIFAILWARLGPHLGPGDQIQVSGVISLAPMKTRRRMPPRVRCRTSGKMPCTTPLASPPTSVHNSRPAP